MKKTFFVTTPIYYTNWVPHIGHSYASLIADVAFRYKKINWFDVKLKIVKKLFWKLKNCECKHKNI